MANREEVVLRGGFDGTGIEQGAKKAFGSLDAQAKRAQAGLNKFGLDADGVLTKLARRFSLTDIAAAAVFATIYKGQKVINDSIKAFEEYDRSISVVGDGITSYSERMDELNRTIRENNVAIGAALSPFAQFGNTLEQAASTGLVRFLETAQEIGREYNKNPFLRAVINSIPGVGLITGPAVGLLGRGPDASSGSAGFARYGPDIPQDFYTSQLRDQEAATKKATEDAMRAAERLFDNIVRQTLPNRGAIAGQPFYGPVPDDMIGMAGPFGIGGPVSVPGPAYRTGPEYNEEALRAYEKAQEKSRQFREEFLGNITSALSESLVQALLFKKNLLDTLKEAFQQVLSSGLSYGINSVLPWSSSTRTAGRSNFSVTPSTQSMARELAPAMRREATVGRGI